MRVALAPDGSIGMDTGPGRYGRGAYVCRDPGCIHRAVAQGAFVRRLKGGSIPQDLEQRLLQEAEGRQVDG